MSNNDFPAIAARQAQRDRAIAEREAREAQSRAAGEAQDARRRAHARADAAARAVLAGGRRVDPLIAKLRHAFVEATFVEPVVTVHWLTPGTRSTELIGPRNGSAFYATRRIVTEAIVDHATAAGALHELGHLREPGGPKLTREVHAWKWAIRHAPTWTNGMQAELVRCVATYVEAAGRADVLGVVAAEQFIRWATTESFRKREQQFQRARRAS